MRRSGTIFGRTTAAGCASSPVVCSGGLLLDLRLGILLLNLLGLLIISSAHTAG